MANNHLYKIIALSFILFAGHLAFAQEKPSAKHKQAVVPVEGAKPREPKKAKPALHIDSGRVESVKHVGPLQSKEITVEFPCNADATVFLENVMYGVKIIATNENKVKMVSTVYYNGKDDKTDEEWLKSLGTRLGGTMENVIVEIGHNLSSPRREKNNVKISLPSSGDSSKAPPLSSAPVSITTFIPGDKQGDRKGRSKIELYVRRVVLYVPAHAKFDIESRYGDINFESNAGEVKIRIDNANLTMKEVRVCNLIAGYARVYADDIRQMKAEVQNGNFIVKSMDHLEMASRNSRVEITSLGRLDIHSDADEYEIEEVEKITGVKNYGDFRVTSLKEAFDITGKGADIKIRRIEATVTIIKIDNQYANLRLPIGDLKNYKIEFDGEGSNIYTPFERKEEAGTPFRYSLTGNGRPTTFSLKCSNCTVDFK